jgi:hypothetical protein
MSKTISSDDPTGEAWNGIERCVHCGSRCENCMNERVVSHQDNLQQRIHRLECDLYKARIVIKVEELAKKRRLIPRPVGCKVDDLGYVLCEECGIREPPKRISVDDYNSDDEKAGVYDEENYYGDDPECECHEREEEEERDAIPTPRMYMPRMHM